MITRRKLRTFRRLLPWAILAFGAVYLVTGAVKRNAIPLTEKLLLYAWDEWTGYYIPTDTYAAQAYAAWSGVLAAAKRGAEAEAERQWDAWLKIYDGAGWVARKVVQ